MKVNKIKSLLSTVFCIILMDAGLGAPVDSLMINLAFKSEKIRQSNDLKMTLTIKSHLQQTVYLPEVDLWGLPSSVDAFYVIQIQKKSSGTFVDLHVRGNIDNIPSFNTDKLHFREEKELSFLLYTLCDFSKGEYRVRILCKFSTLNKLRDKYSNWAYFKCDDDIAIK